MPAAECASRNERQKERRATAARRSFALYHPRPQLLGDFTKETVNIKNKTLWDELLAARGWMTDAFFGASPVVASASGIRSGATPRGRLQPNTLLPARPSKQDISTLLGLGHFYFALTGGGFEAHGAAGRDVAGGEGESGQEDAGGEEGRGIGREGAGEPAVQEAR